MQCSCSQPCCKPEHLVRIRVEMQFPPCCQDSLAAHGRLQRSTRHTMLSGAQETLAHRMAHSLYTQNNMCGRATRGAEGPACCTPCAESKQACNGKTAERVWGAARMHDEHGRLDLGQQAQVVVHVQPAGPPAPARVHDAHPWQPVRARAEHRCSACPGALLRHISAHAVMPHMSAQLARGRSRAGAAHLRPGRCAGRRRPGQASWTPGSTSARCPRSALRAAARPHTVSVGAALVPRVPRGYRGSIPTRCLPARAQTGRMVG